MHVYFDGNHSQTYLPEDDEVLLEGLERVPDYSGVPAFFYFHLMSVHFLGSKHERYNYFKPSKVGTNIWAFYGGEYEREALVNRYDNGVLQADAYIESLFKVLERKGYLSNSLIFILSDHGEGLGERGHFGHDYYLYQEDISIPFLIYDDEEASYNNLQFAAHIDVAPTILDRLGLPIPDCWEGQSLLNGKIRSFNYHQTRWWPNFIYGVLYREPPKIYKYIRWTKSNNSVATREELYELTQDPGERDNIMSSVDPGLISRLRKKMGEGFDIQVQSK
jgi:arylsulfatase A-like enzyme